MERVLTYAVLGLVAVRLASATRLSFSRDGQSTVRQVWRRAGWRHVWPVPVVLTGVVAAASALMIVPGLDWGWWSALGGQGNPLAGSTDETVGTVWEWLIPLAFLLMLFPALPLFALAEERIFRRGAEGWSWARRVWRTVAFGLVHAVVGIPIAVALALSVGGVYFLAVYLRRARVTGDRHDALLESTAAHTVYNTMILGVVFVAVVATALGWE